LSQLELGPLRVLTTEAVRDAIRRRVVFAVVIVCILCLFMIDSCTSCNADIRLEGDIGKSLDVLGWGGMAVFCVLALWVITLAGLLAADHLSQSLDDGSAQLVLARPVSRETFALSRLAGSLLVSLGAGVILLGGATVLLAMRNGLALTPALLASLACVLSSVAVASSAMTASLYLPKVATILLVLVAVVLVSVLNLASVSGVELQGFYRAIDQLGPPLASSIALALAPWSGQVAQNVGALGVTLRLLAWAAGGVALLAFCFRRHAIVQRGSG
jgi:ABC-type transport system involved in multi-copper enzyme maturation permease subunit